MTQQEVYLGNYGFRYTRYKKILQGFNDSVSFMRSNNSQLVIIEDRVTR